MMIFHGLYRFLRMPVAWACLFLGTLLGWTACSSEETGLSVEPTDDRVKVTLAVQTRADDASTPLDPESTLQTLRIYAFQKKTAETSVSYKLVGYYYEDFQSSNAATDQKSITMELPAGTTVFYVVGNEESAEGLKVKGQESPFIWPAPETSNPSPSDLEKLEITPDQLNDLVFTQLPEPKLLTPDLEEQKSEAGKIYQNAYLPMTAQKEMQISTGAYVSLELKRSVAKLYLFFAKVGVHEDKLYMGRGLYLYNQPSYGYLFPPQKLAFQASEFKYLERENPDDLDSKQNQKNGRVILKSGIYDENPGDTPGGNLEEMIDINEIKTLNNTPGSEVGTALYEILPNRPIYLFANPYRVQDASIGYLPTNPSEAEHKGYYMKILAHFHKVGYDDEVSGQPEDLKHEGQMFYVSLPEVNPNDRLVVRSKIVVDGYASIRPYWKVVPWTEKGGDITFE